MRPSPDGFVPAVGFLENALAPRPSFNDGSPPVDLDVVGSDGRRQRLKSLRTPASTYGKQVRYCVYEFDVLLDSSSIDSSGWSQIGQTIFDNYRSDFDGFVVLHGTDSLAYTCSALSFMLQDLGKPVIFTGSQVPMMELQNDATDNLLGSLILASHFIIPEVCLFFNHKLLRGNRSTKTSATDFDAFSSPNCPALATITAMGAQVAWPLVNRATALRPLTLQRYLNIAHVVTLRVFPGIKVEMVDAVLRVPGLRGMILETFGAGNAPDSADGAMNRVLSEAVGRGIVIVNVTQCLSGVVSPLYAPATVLGRAGVVFGHDMTSEAALTKLSYLLAKTQLSSDEVAQQMSRSLRGELHETAKTVFQHPEAPTVDIAKLAQLNQAIQEGHVESVRGMINEDEFGATMHQADYMGVTPLHVAAAGARAEVVLALLSRGASVHARDRSGQTPLSYAVQHQQMENAKLLLQAGGHPRSPASTAREGAGQ